MKNYKEIIKKRIEKDVINNEIEIERQKKHPLFIYKQILIECSNILLKIVENVNNEINGKFKENIKLYLMFNSNSNKPKEINKINIFFGNENLIKINDSIYNLEYKLNDFDNFEVTYGSTYDKASKYHFELHSSIQPNEIIKLEVNENNTDEIKTEIINRIESFIEYFILNNDFKNVKY
jgi:hypothetical protein